MKRKSKKIRVEIIKEATRDFYGMYNPDFKIVSDYLRRKKTPKLTDEQKEAVWYIRQNLLDETYRKSVVRTL